MHLEGFSCGTVCFTISLSMLLFRNCLIELYRNFKVYPQHKNYWLIRNFINLTAKRLSMLWRCPSRLTCRCCPLASTWLVTKIFTIGRKITINNLMCNEQVIVWCNVANFSVWGLRSFEKGGQAITVAFDWYKELLRNFLQPKFTEFENSDGCFQQDRATLKIKTRGSV